MLTTGSLYFLRPHIGLVSKCISLSLSLGFGDFLLIKFRSFQSKVSTNQTQIKYFSPFISAFPSLLEYLPTRAVFFYYLFFHRINKKKKKIIVTSLFQIISVLILCFASALAQISPFFFGGGLQSGFATPFNHFGSGNSAQLPPNSPSPTNTGKFFKMTVPCFFKDISLNSCKKKKNRSKECLLRLASYGGVGGGKDVCCFIADFRLRNSSSTGLEMS